MSNSPTSAGLRVAREIMPLAVHILNGVMDEEEVAAIIDRQFREATEALRGLLRVCDPSSNPVQRIAMKDARAALARLEGTE